MAEIRATVTIVDNASATLRTISRELNSIARGFEQLGTIGGGATSTVSTGVQQVNVNATNLNRNVGKSIGLFRQMRYSALNVFILTMAFRSLFRTIQSATDKVDEFNLTIKRLEMGLENFNQVGLGSGAIFNEITKSAERSRSSIIDTASTVSKLSLQAPHAFNDMQEIVHFSELLNKSFKVAGTSVESQRAGMYQLNQALASNRLQGDEFRSIIENMPQLTRYLNKELGTTHAQLRKLASEGKLSAEVIKRAVFNASDEINRRFDSMPKTWGERFTQAGNMALVAFQPVFERMSAWANSPMMEKALDFFETRMEAIAKSVLGVMDNLEKISAWFQTDGKRIEFVMGTLQTILMAVMSIKLIGWIKGAATAVAGLAGKLSALAAAHPVLAAIAVAVGVVVWLINTGDLAVQDLLYTIGHMAASGVNFLWALAVGFVALVVYALATAAAIGLAFANLFIFLGYGWETIKAGWAALWVFALGMFAKVWAYIYNFFATGIEWIVNQFLELKYAAAKVGYDINLAFYNLLNGLGNGFANAINSWITLFEGFGNRVIDMINGIVDRFNSSGLVKGLAKVGLDLSVGKIGGINLDRVGNPFAGMEKPVEPVKPEEFKINRKNIETTAEIMDRALGAFAALRPSAPEYHDITSPFRDATDLISEFASSVDIDPDEWGNALVNKLTKKSGSVADDGTPYAWWTDRSRADAISADEGAAGGAGGGGGGGRIGSVGKIEKPIQLSDEAMKLLAEMAEHKWSDRYGSVSNEVHVHYISNNNGSSEENLAKNANMISKMIINKLATNMNL